MAPSRERMSVAEFASLVALLTSLVALSIDAMLPALPEIGSALGVTQQNDTQLVIGLFLLGNTVGQLLFGPLSDAFGRKPVIVTGLTLFLLGCFISVIAESFATLLLGRVLQGVGANQLKHNRTKKWSCQGEDKRRGQSNRPHTPDDPKGVGGF